MLGHTRRLAPATETRIAAFVCEHEPALLRLARHWSLCADDAADAWQRTLEIYVRRVETLSRDTELAWVKVVLRNEALAIRRQRSESVSAQDIDLDDRPRDAQRPVDELLAARERVERSREVLSRLKPDEAKALLLKGQGLSYAEIAQRLGWSYTKVNRCVTEGRARFLTLFAELEAGQRCEAFAPTLAALAAGTADADALVELRPHLRHCTACRATVRELHGRKLGRLAALWPLPALIPLRWVGGRPAASPDGELLVLPADPPTGPVEPLDVPNLYEAIERIDPATLPPPSAPPGRWLELKAQLYGWMQRLQGTDVVAAAQVSAGTGGGRIATVGAVLGLCLSSLGAGTVCVVTGIMENPLAPAPKPAQSEAKRAAPKPERRVPAQRRREPKAALPVATPEPTPAPRPKADTSPDRAPRAEPKRNDSHEDPVASSAPANAAPAGGSEFDPAYVPTPPVQQAAPSQTGGGGEFF